MDPNARWKGLKQNATEAMWQIEEVSDVGEDTIYAAKSGILFFKKKDKIATVNLAANSILGATAKRSIAKALGRKMAERL